MKIQMGYVCLYCGELQQLRVNTSDWQAIPLVCRDCGHASGAIRLDYLPRPVVKQREC